ncbi:PP2C family protein-serine/threonine phosphatase [Kitasatospora sp. NPDC101801]|uniref:PP2C family protein-serine/threonine phosphatase n=1 Tax=Kitasatospora sp. NPDC101801 TaxID=3364103 RepID=UPI00382555F1
MSTPDPQTTAPVGALSGARTPRWVRALPALLVAVDLTAEYAASAHIAAGFPLTVLPVLVAFGYGPVAVALSTFGTVALQGVMAERVGHLTEQHHLWIYLATAVAGVLGAVLSWQRIRQEHDLVQVRSVAEALQRTVLHPVPPRSGGLRTAGLYRAAQAEVPIGGDLYSICETRYGTRVLLGDVRGKGLDAVRTVADLLGAFRAMADETGSLNDLADLLDRQLQRVAGDRDDQELFATATLLQHDPATGRCLLVNRGHHAPLVTGPAGVREVDAPEQLPLGLGGLTAAAPAAPAAFTLEPGHTLLLFTDGLTEARDRAGEFYPVAERLAVLAGTDPEHLVAALDADVRARCGLLTDDLAILALTPLGPGPDGPSD